MLVLFSFLIRCAVKSVTQSSSVSVLMFDIRTHLIINYMLPYYYSQFDCKGLDEYKLPLHPILLNLLQKLHCLN